MSRCWSRLRAESAVPGLLASAAVKNYTDWWLKQQMLFLPVLEAEKSKIKVLRYWVPSEGPLPDSQMAICLLCPHMVGRERKASSLLSLL